MTEQKYTTKFASLKKYRDSFAIMHKTLRFTDGILTIPYHQLHDGSNIYYVTRCDIEGIVMLYHDNGTITFEKTDRFIGKQYILMKECIRWMGEGVYWSWPKTPFLKEGVFDTYYSKICTLEGLQMQDDKEDNIMFSVIKLSDAFASAVLTSNPSQPLGEPQLTDLDDIPILLIDQLQSNYKKSCKDHDIKLEESFQKVIVAKILGASNNYKKSIRIDQSELFEFKQNKKFYHLRCASEKIGMLVCGEYPSDNCVNLNPKYRKNLIYYCGECTNEQIDGTVKIFFMTKISKGQ
jgi:hypothetical protein